MDKLSILRIKTEEGMSIHYPALYEALPEDYKLYARRELNETEENKIQGLQRLRDIMKNENLSCPDDDYLLSLLKITKYCPDRSEAKLRKALKARQTIVNQVSKLDMAKVANIIDDKPFVILPYRDSLGRIIVYSRPSVDLDKYDMDEALYCGLATLLFLLTYPLTAINGWVLIADCRTPSVYLFYPITRSFKKIIPSSGNLAARFGRMDIINEHFLARWGLCIVRAFLPEKLNKRVFAHGHHMKRIKQIYHPDLLPSDIGGNLGPITNKHYREKLLAFIENLKNEAT